MLNSFKTLRMKLGVGMLVASLVFAAGWVDSLTNCREITFYPTQSIFHYWTSSSHHGKLTASWVKLPRVQGPPLPFYERTDIERFPDWPGVPYWSIVLPLIALSAWLLLSKPRINKSAPVMEP